LTKNNLPEKLTGNESQFVKEYFDYYKTTRGFHPRAFNSNTSWTATTPLAIINFKGDVQVTCLNPLTEEEFSLANK
jgi:hypothetical protein